MKRLSHVLILIILVLPLLAVVPNAVTVSTASANPAVPADFSPAQFKEEQLRVAVYAEDNGTLPAYATGGVYSSNYNPIVTMLTQQGYAVTELTTQDIMDHELLTKYYDVFVLADQLPRESIADLVKDFWLGGGGILSLHSSIGYLFYYGMVIDGLEGNFALLGVDPDPHWGYDFLLNLTVGERNPVTKQFALSDNLFLNQSGIKNDRSYINAMNPNDFGDLLYETLNPVNSYGFSLDNGDRRGGRIVQLNGNYTTAPAWWVTMLGDAVDWLTPRPRARIAFEMTHVPYLPIDEWDPFSEAFFFSGWRDGLVNHSYTVDKFRSPLTVANLMGYDMLVISLPEENFTAQEVQDIRTYVDNGGGLFLLGDNPLLSDGDSHLNYLLTSFDITLNLNHIGAFDVLADKVGFHPLYESVSMMEYDSGCYLNLTGDAFPLWMDGGNVLCAAQEYGSGRILVSGDLNIMSDWLALHEQHNYRFLMNVANWLSSATADVLLLNGEFLNDDTDRVAPALALGSLGINYFLIKTPYYMNYSIYEYWDQWDLVICDEPGSTIIGYTDCLYDWVAAGGELIISYYFIHNQPDDPLWPLLGVYPDAGAADEPDVHIWVSGHPIFNIPVDYGETLFEPIIDYGTEGSKLHVFSNATALAGYTASSTANETAIAIRNDFKTLTNAFLIDEFQGDYDDSTYMDSFELWVNEIGFMYYERPVIDSPADVTYVVGETGNEILWSPTADAGPLRYVLQVNGTLDTISPWNGAPIAVNIDNVNVSLTTYQLTVTDRLGYSATDTVILNVTAYIPPPGGLNPLLLVAVGAGVVIIIVIVLLVQKKGKK